MSTETGISARHLVKFSEELMRVIEDFKEEMEILSDEELMKQIRISEENSKKGKTLVLKPEDLEKELGL